MRGGPFRAALEMERGHVQGFGWAACGAVLPSVTLKGHLDQGALKFQKPLFLAKRRVIGVGRPSAGVICTPIFLVGF